ncbi:MAG: DNA polymerase III subunit delta, partial [Bacteroidales bacterium]|nr:DNA polymerase III subunit delta [Bacteroidales bacterium]MCF8337033.1 DNA polymerase III subunit delta [Bacteroidales bacterium]
MDHKEILNNLRKKIYHPIYFLHGDEPYFIDLVSDYIEENVLTAEQKEFNQIVTYGKDTNVSQLMSLTRQLPIGAPYQVIIVK